MFNKLEVFGLVTVALIGGFAIGYSKAREICLAAIINATGQKDEKTENEKES
jgi:hypothetical protein